jgi:alkylhydroperoxidase family enzyme
METYYHPKDLSKFEEIGKEAPELGKKFFEYYAAVFAEGELTEREKALIALAVAHTIQCPYCIQQSAEEPHWFTVSRCAILPRRYRFRRAMDLAPDRFIG